MLHLQKTAAKRTGLKLEHNKALLVQENSVLVWNMGLSLCGILSLKYTRYLTSCSPIPLKSSNIKAKALHCFYQKNLNT